MTLLRIRLTKCYLHFALTSTDSRLITVRLWRPDPTPSSTPNSVGDAHEPYQPASAQNPSPT